MPLFVEELTKAVLEGDGDDNSAEGQSISALALPTTLHASLMARLDRLGLGPKQVAQTGAAIGREFSYELLAAAAGRPERQLRDELARLVNSELVFQRGAFPESVYTFKHALVQDVAYSTLLRSDRQQLHARIAEAIERRFPERIAREPELLAHHFTQARQSERAIGYWLKAGERAAQRSANREAIRHLTRGLEALQTLPESPERDRRELAYQIALGTPLIAVYGYSAQQTGTAYLCMLAAAYAQVGHAEPGLGIIAEAKDLVGRNDEHMWEGELSRIEGELLRVQGASAPEIEACFIRAMGTTRAQSARSLELRAALSLARMWCDQGRRSDAHALLAPTFNWFTEGFETADLRAAKALLDKMT